MRDYSKLIEKINTAGSILIFTHANMDGDALGSSGALCLALRSLGKKAAVLTQSPCPAYLRFADQGFLTGEVPFDADLSIAVDMGSDSRLEGLKEVFYRSKDQICIDHHVRDEAFLTDVVVDPAAAACGCLIYELLRQMGVAISVDMANLLYLAVLTDTGSFRYANTGKEAMVMAGELIDLGVEPAAICNRIYASYPLSQLRLEGIALDRARLLCEGKGILTYVCEDDYRATGSNADEADSCIDRIRTVENVEIAAVLKQRGSVYKLSCRAKEYADVRRICMTFGGGGHLRASGATLDLPLDLAMEAVAKAIEEELSR
ncbi:MAG: bifunctional oligoribonuclease/PAP phosphatase NrnA [Firmicutes bacterium]|nr:bifunctional oligoribonuclease/PAP phosphatase NrnA [Bacillota bacterium]